MHLIIIDSFNWIMFEDDPGSDYNYMTDFNFETDPPEMEFMARILSATDPDLSKFGRKGRKIIMYHCWGDVPVAPLNTVGYRDDVIALLGEEKTNDFLKLYMIPGMGHCRGGVGHDEVDYLTPLVDWVENGNEPGPLVGTKASDGSTRKHCPYPQVAQYDGSGDTNDEANCNCVEPDDDDDDSDSDKHKKKKKGKKHGHH